MLYDIAQTVFLRQTGRKHEAGETVELSEEDAKAILSSDPGILKAHRVTEQAHPEAAREAPKPRVRRTSRAKR